jgi:hypothetical protein
VTALLLRLAGEGEQRKRDALAPLAERRAVQRTLLLAEAGRNGRE